MASLPRSDLRALFSLTLIVCTLTGCVQTISFPTSTSVPTIAPTHTPTQTPIPPIPTLANWEVVSSMPIPRFESNAVVLDGLIYVAGGITASHSLKSFARFDPSTNTWGDLAPLPDFRNHLGMAVLDGKIYISGGIVGEFGFEGQAKTLWVYDPTSDQWSSLAEMPFGRAEHGMAEIDGKLYVAGGITWRAGDATELWAYDPTTDTWDTSRAHLPTQRDHLIVTAYEEKLYVVGGRYGNNLASLEIYDPASNTWTKGPDMPTARSGMGFAILDGQLHTIAGEDVDRRLIYRKHEVFDFASQTWTQLPDIPLALNAPIAVPMNGFICVMGGGGFSGVPYGDVWRFTP